MWVAGTFRIARNCMPPTQILIRIFSKWPNSGVFFCPYWQYEYLNFFYEVCIKQIDVYGGTNQYIPIVMMMGLFLMLFVVRIQVKTSKGRPTSQSWKSTLGSFFFDWTHLDSFDWFFLSTHKERAHLSTNITFLGLLTILGARKE